MRTFFWTSGVAFLFGCSAIGCDGSSTTATSGGELLCIPGEQKACPCPHGVQGAQACLEDGSGYGTCLGCGGSGGASTTSSTGSMSTTGSGGAGGMSSSSTTGSGGAGGMSSSSTTGSGGTGATGSSSSTGSGGTGATGSTTGSGGTGGTGSSSSTGSGGDAGTPVCNVPGNCVYKIPLPETTQSASGISCTFCPGGPEENSNPPKCILELDLGNAALNLMAVAPDGGPPQVSASGPIPMRLQELPLTCSYLGIPFNTTAVINGNAVCPPNPQQFANVSVQAMLAINDATPINDIHVGCSALTSITLDVDSVDLSNALRFCGGSSPPILDAMKSLFVTAFAPIIEQGAMQAIDGQVCASP